MWWETRAWCDRGSNLHAVRERRPVPHVANLPRVRVRRHRLSRAQVALAAHVDDRLDGCREGSGEGVRTRSWEGLPSKRGRHREDGRTLPAREAEAARHGGVVLARVRGAVPRLVLDAPLPVELLLASQ